MANPRIGNDARMEIQRNGTSSGWQQGSKPHQGDDGRGRETRAELARTAHLPAIQVRNW